MYAYKNFLAKIERQTLRSIGVGALGGLLSSVLSITLYQYLTFRPLRVEHGALFGRGGVPSDKGQLLEIAGDDPGLAISANNTDVGAEAYIAGYMKDRRGAWIKIGATAFQFTDPDPKNGFASWNVHTTELVNGVSSDNIGIAVWGNRGVTFFPRNLEAPSAPGPNIVKINGALQVASQLSIASAMLFVDGGSLKVRLEDGTVKTLASGEK